ncbi:MAG: hypothetical protein NT062_11870, partial [Proteobacteria bacterium]|nr:hypothetical protein [Pseudomonadota bacterium]
MRARLFLIPLLLAIVGCQPVKGGTTGGGGGAGGGARIQPDACGKIDGTDAGRKLHAFLVASAELDRASIELESTMLDACKRMAVELGTSPTGTTKEVCERVSKDLQANLQISVKSEQRLVTRYKPAVCHTDIDVTAGFVAECEASASATADVKCHGTCGGTCTGACDGSCATGDNATCAGACTGECKGKCTGGCDGYAEVTASAECKASAEVRASVKTECTEPKVEVVTQDVTIIDDSKFKKAVAAINIGLPRILVVARRLELAGKALGHWVSTGASLVGSTAELVGELGAKAVCVTGQVAG